MWERKEGSQAGHQRNDSQVAQVALNELHVHLIYELSLNALNGKARSAEADDLPHDTEYSFSRCGRGGGGKEGQRG